MNIDHSKTRREKIKASSRHKVAGTTERPRLCVFRSNAQIYAQLIDDSQKKTLITVSSLDKSLEKISKSEKSKKVGVGIAERAKAIGISTVVFDRNGFVYHGRIKVLADAAREGGLNF
jgi:large subunit ribosomal protein L18